MGVLAPAEDDSVHGVCVVDADCEVSGNLLGAVAARLERGRTRCRSPIWSPIRTARRGRRCAGPGLLCSTSFVRSAGIDWACRRGCSGREWRSRAGCCCGHHGPRSRSPRTANSICGGCSTAPSVVFAREAEVRSPSPSTGRRGAGSGARWESGRTRAGRAVDPEVAGASPANGSVAQLDAAFEPVLPSTVAAACDQRGRPRGLSARRLPARARWATGGLSPRRFTSSGDSRDPRPCAGLARAFARCPAFSLAGW